MQNCLAISQNFNWDDLRLLLALSGHASFLETGRALGIATTTVSRRLAALEASVGTQLISRTHVGAPLTPTGARLVKEVEPLAMALEAAMRAAAGGDSQVAGSIKLSVVEGLAPLVLAGIQSFREAHPGVVFELDISHRSVDMSKDEADLALRTLKPRSPGLVLRKVRAIHMGVYASSLHVAAKSLTSPVALLARSDAVLLGGDMAGLKETLWLRSMVRTVSLQTQTMTSLIDAVRRGIGVGVIPDEMIAGDPTLRRVCDCDAATQKTLWLVMSQRTARVARVRLFADHITQYLR